MMKEKLTKKFKDEGVKEMKREKLTKEDNELKTSVIGTIIYKPKDCIDPLNDRKDKMISLNEVGKEVNKMNNELFEKINEQINMKLKEKDKIIDELKNEVEKWKKIVKEKN